MRVITTAESAIQNEVIAMLLIEVAPPFDSNAKIMASEPHMIDT